MHLIASANRNSSCFACVLLLDCRHVSAHFIDCQRISFLVLKVCLPPEVEASIRDFFFEITLIMVALAPFIALSTSGDLRHVGGDNGGIDDYDAHGARLDGGVLGDAGA